MKSLSTSRSCTSAPHRRSTGQATGSQQPRPARSRLHTLAASPGEAAQQAEPSQSVDLQSAMQAARQNAVQGLSPGAGLGSAEEQAEAAYADLINTSVDLTGSASSLSEGLISDLEAGGNMETAQKKGHKLGVLGDALQLWTALSGGAHIVKQDDGRV